MKAAKRPSFYLSDDEISILDATAKRLGLSRSEVIRHLILYQGLCGGDFPLTRKILDLPSADRDRVIGQIRKSAESDTPAKPQSFRKWVEDTLGSSDPETMKSGVDALLRKMLE